MKPSRTTTSLKVETEKALRAIDEYERSKHKHTIITTLRTQGPDSGRKAIPREFAPQEVVRLQLLPNSIVYYSLRLCSNIEPKIIIRQFKGEACDMFVNFEKLPKHLQQSLYTFSIRDDLIVKIDPHTVSISTLIFIMFRSSKSLTMFNFRMDLARKKKQSSQRASSNNSLASISVSKQKSPKERSKSRLQRIKSSRNMRLKSIESEDLFSNRPENRIRKIEELKLIENERKEASKVRIANCQIFKEKEAEARIVSHKCKDLVDKYQELVREQDAIKSQLLKDIVPIVHLIKFAMISSTLALEREKKMNKVFMVKSYVKKFTKNIKHAHRSTKQMMPDLAARQLQIVAMHTTVTSFVLYRGDYSRAVGAIFETFELCSHGLIVNLAMRQASKYRRYVREIQRKWKSKYHNRTRMLHIYAEEQLRQTVESYPHLQIAVKSYRQANAHVKICQQYQRDVAGKLKGMREAYFQKLEEIKEYQKMNEEIKKFNSSALRKNQRELLDVPRTPCCPTHRFFRDLMFLKSMIRGWLELELRKWKRMNSKMASPGKESRRKK